MIILLLSGWAGSGKDATAGILSTYGYKRYAFADVLKRQVAAEFKFPLEWCYSQRGKLQKVESAGHKTVRDLLIQRGQEIRAEKENPGYFAEIIAKQLTDDLCEKVVIADWRLECELQTMREYLFMNAKIVTVRIQRAGQTESPVSDSLTEHELDTFKFDVILENPGASWEGLEKEIMKKLAVYLTADIDTSPV